MEKVKKFIRNNTVTGLIFSLFFVYGFNFYFFKDNTIGNNSFFNLVLLILCIILIKKNEDIKIKDKIVPLIFAFILSLASIIGKVIYDTNDISTMYNVRDIIFSIITLIGFTKIVGEVLYIVFEKIRKLSVPPSTMWKFYNKKYFFIAIWAIVFISYIPAYLSYYPGNLKYDSEWQTEQAMGNLPYEKFHPPIHTFIWQICINLCSNTSIDPLIVYSILQMLFVSFVIAKLIKMLVNRNLNNWVILGAILFSTLNPVIAVFSFTMTKDVYFAGFLLLFVMQIVDLIEKQEEFLKSPKKWIVFCITVLLTCLFRNNAIYVFVMWVVIAIIVLRKYWNKAIILLSIPICLYTIVNSGIYPALCVFKATSREAFSVPIQQVARVAHYHNDELDEQTINKLNSFINYQRMVDMYNPRFADPVKGSVHLTNFENNKKEFIKLWFELFKKYPSEYISAFLSLNLPYWYFDANTVDEYSKVQYIEYGIYNNDTYTTKPESKIPKLKELYDRVITFEFAERKPIIVTIFSITTPFWLSLFTVFVLIYKKHYKYILVVLPILLLWLTHMAGPVSNFRYVFAMIIQYPLLIALMFYNKKEMPKT